MKKQILSEEFRRMQKLAGIITEGQNSPPIKNVYKIKDGKADETQMVGTHQYNVGFKPNELGKKLGYKENKTSIPDGTTFKKEEEMNENKKTNLLQFIEKNQDEITFDLGVDRLIDIQEDDKGDIGAKVVEVKNWAIKKIKNIGLENLKGFKIGADSEVRDLIPSGHAELDHAISSGIVQGNSKFKFGGFPLGRVILFYGNEGSGKSSLAYRLVGSAQRMNYKCAWIDTEHSFSDQLALVNGVDKSVLYYNNLINEENPDEIATAEINTMMITVNIQ